MKNYDQLKDFIDYADRGVWKSYIKESIVPLWKKAWILREHFENLKSEMEGAPLKTLDENERKLVLGGIVQSSSDDIYRRNSLAKFYSNFFGLRIEDVQSYLLSKKESGVQTEITIEVSETSFLELVEKVHNMLDLALNMQYLIDRDYPDYDYDDLKHNPNKVRNIIENFYTGVLNLTSNYSYHTFFLNSVNQLPRKFLEKAYPRFSDIEDFLRNEFGLVDLEWNIPFDPDTDLYEKYSIVCFPEYGKDGEEKSFGGAICNFNEEIWSKFSYSSDLKKTLKTLFNRVPDLRKEFRERVKSQITTPYHGKIYFKGVTAAESRSDLERSGKSLMDLLDENAPHLFTGLRKIQYFYEDGFNFTTV